MHRSYVLGGPTEPVATRVVVAIVLWACCPHVRGLDTHNLNFGPFFDFSLTVCTCARSPQDPDFGLSAKNAAELYYYRRHRTVLGHFRAIVRFHGMGNNRSVATVVVTGGSVGAFCAQTLMNHCNMAVSNLLPLLTRKQNAQVRQVLPLTRSV